MVKAIKNTPQKIRIIGGSLKRMQLPVADVPGLRPTPDRVRETLFNWIQHLWQGQYADKAVLDLFAGTGALGFEAASRGVSHVQMVEPHPKALQNLRAIRDKFNLSQVRIHSHDALLVLNRMDASRFDLVMLDPPFQSDLLEQVKPFLPNITKPNGLVYIESDKPQALPAPFELIRESKAGMVFFHLFEYVE
ncbi:16S rRNA (guanine(966)-N(2))-methyltransferase RsmD [Pelistega europaea]|uniref:16S rRNA (Guanine(966)-N(2))-methyltransferase RsmD n=1 Tax=Pelistega europaea TaxID=106147 RepID=A0A7Y4LBH8_9BURK|nr:16S rRNA (guanine(966)-N(2))-methyltransferase RsmD [Pelistega europaea]NOL50478.1 16S rRNA (guanine(966)-N(2))-methyltransferase RsmD [Pelistega europaea]